MKYFISTLFYMWIVILFTTLSILFVAVNIVSLLIVWEPWPWSIYIYGFIMLRAHGIYPKRLGHEVPDNEALIFIMNHQSYLDIFVLAYLMGGRKCTACAAHWLTWKWHPLGWAFALFNVIPVYRHDDIKKWKAVEQAKKAVNQKGWSVIILPEGTRTLDGEIQHFKIGAFEIARETQARMIPITITGFWETKSKKTFCFNFFQKTLMYVGRPLDPPCTEMGLEELKTYRDNIESLMKKTYERWRKHVA